VQKRTQNPANRNVLSTQAITRGERKWFRRLWGGGSDSDKLVRGGGSEREWITGLGFRRFSAWRKEEKDEREWVCCTKHEWCLPYLKMSKKLDWCLLIFEMETATHEAKMSKNDLVRERDGKMLAHLTLK